MPRAFSTILPAGLVAGTLDITAAIGVYAHFGPRTVPLLQGIAAGVLGKTAAAQGGLATAFLGLFCHYCIAMTWAVVFYAASRKLTFLRDHAVASGVIYGIVVYAVMNLVVVPLSEIGPRPFTLSGTAIGAGILVVCIGLPISLITRRFADRA
jgi:hypothetical protein